MTVANPVIQLIPDNKKGLKILSDYLDLNDKESELIRDYPTVYIHNWENSDKFEVYVGESNDFFQRTQQHFDDENKRDAWQKNIKDKDAKLYVIAHPEFNKSLTLDVENRLIHYLSSSSSVVKIHNARGNPQNKYYPCEEFDSIFSKIWRQLRTYNRALFLSESEIKDSAIYKASPLHKLNFEQAIAKEKIIDKITECLLKDKENQLVFVQGDAGTGKTVLMSSMFYDLINKKEHVVETDGTTYKDLECAIVVNHVEQLTVYEEIVRKLDLAKKDENIVFNPTTLINLFKDKKNSPKKRDKLFDVIFVDEAHLLLTQNNQSFTDNNQLNELIKYAKVVVVMFDKKQILNSEQYKDDNEINEYIKQAKDNDSYIELKTQMRMMGNKKVLHWIKTITNDGKIEKVTKHRGNYDIKVFDDPSKLEQAIKLKASDKKTMLSRIVATYDWPYSSASSPKDDKYWNVKIGNWKRPWNREILRYGTKKDARAVKGLAWAEQPQTINEIGSTYTIQGFDLNYAGVIIGPSIKYRNGKIIYDTKASCNKKATNKRTMNDGSHVSFGEEFLKNELGVLLTRGVNGLYIYACDDELREVLKKSLQ
ncbi:MAG: DUF2075 domain-containing protein [Bacilli bacterium]|nr:DUF2075 domain-containing protein [Bacilli bacterium]